VVIALLRRPGGVSVAEVVAESGWQPHTLSGLFSRTRKKKLGLRSAQEDRGRVYRTIDADRTASAAVASEPCGARSLDAAFMTGAGLVIDGGITAQ
jgi:hypothetical protein